MAQETWGSRFTGFAAQAPKSSAAGTGQLQGTRLGLLQGPDDLLFGESAPLHGSSSRFYPANLPFTLDQFFGEQVTKTQLPRERFSNKERNTKPSPNKARNVSLASLSNSGGVEAVFRWNYWP